MGRRGGYTGGSSIIYGSGSSRAEIVIHEDVDEEFVAKQRQREAERTRLAEASAEARKAKGLRPKRTR